VSSGETGAGDEDQLRGVIAEASAELAAMGLDPAVCTLCSSRYLPQNVLDHDEFDKRVETLEAAITNGEKEKSKYGKLLKDATSALKELRGTSPLLLRGEKDRMERHFLEQQRTAKDKLKEIKRQLLGTKIGLNTFYETRASMDADEYHRVLGDVLDRKTQAHKALRAISISRR
jgi:hypothetical protein